MPRFKRNRDGLGAITGSQLLHDVLDVHFHRFFGDEQTIGDVAVAIAAGNLLEDLDLACGKVFIGIVLGQSAQQLRAEFVSCRRGLCEWPQSRPSEACSLECSLAHLSRAPAEFRRRLPR